MPHQDLKGRTKQFALRIMNLVEAVPQNVQGRAIASQLIRSGTAVGANYRAACCGRSQAEFAAKLGIVIEEVDESVYWLELNIDGKLLPEQRVSPLLQEAREILAIMIASRKTVQKHRGLC
jgi:four helix bundle protein